MIFASARSSSCVSLLTSSTVTFFLSAISLRMRACSSLIFCRDWVAWDFSAVDFRNDLRSEKRKVQPPVTLIFWTCQETLYCHLILYYKDQGTFYLALPINMCHQQKFVVFAVWTNKWSVFIILPCFSCANFVFMKIK